MEPFNVDKYLAFGNSSFGAVKLTKNVDPDKISILDMVLDLMHVEVFHHQMVVSLTKNMIIFGADMSSSEHIDNKKKDILILGHGSTDGLHDTMLIAEKSFFKVMP